jgi:hypothetical protein
MTDSRLVAQKLASNWHAKVERGEIALDQAFDLLVERVAALAPSFGVCPTCGLRPCPDPGFCQNCRDAGQKMAASRRCAQCGAGGTPLDPYRDGEQQRVVYLHPQCKSFWETRHR